MTYEGLNWQTMSLPFRAGLMQKADDRARPQPFLDIAKDIQFDELGGIQTRLPFLAMSNAIFGGGTLANCRRLAVVNDELCVFTDVALYSWNAQLSAWVLRATHLAVSVDERPAFVTTGDQSQADRAELNGTVMYTFADGSGSYIAAMDKTTGAVLMAPLFLGAGIVRPRLVAAATRIIAFIISGTSMQFAVFDPANPAAGSFAVLFSTVVAGPYDVVRVEGQDLVVGAFQRTVNTSYTVFTVAANGAATSSTKARTANGPLAVSTTPTTGLQTQIVYGSGTAIQGDLLTTSTLADVTVAIAVGTAASATINQIAVSFAAVNVVRAFWTSGTVGENTTGATFEVKTNTVTSGIPGSQASLVMMAGIASRAFTCAGHVYVWVAFAQENVVTGLSGAVSVGVRAQVQNTYLLYRDDRMLIGKALFDVAGGHSALAGYLPGVASTSATGLDFAWCGTRRRIIKVGGDAHEGFEARSPTDVRFSFDSDLSRRSAAIGRTLYVTDSIPLAYDGVGLFEVGFLIYPYDFFVTTGGAGAIAAGDYTYKSTLAWTNAQGEKERSTTAMGAKITAPGANKNAIQVSALNYTRKITSGAVPTVEVWRTPVNPPDDAPFYLVSGKDPSVLAGGGTNNAYVPNDVNASFVPSTGFFVLNDSFADATLITKEKNPENGAALEALAPPGASLILTTDTRVFLAGVPGDPDAVWYSRLRNEGEIASFHDGNRMLVPRPGGRITALAIHNETLTVFRETAVYRLPGEGINNAGGGSNFAAFEVPGGVGAVSQESVASTQVGTLFKSSKGWYLLTPGWSVQYVGGAVSDYDTETVRAVTHVDKQHQVRILSGSRMIVWDYSAVTEESPIGQWFEWTVGSGIHALMWQGQYVILTPTGPAIPRTTYTGGDFGMDVETAWIKLADLQGAAACRKVQPLGEIRSLDFLLRVRVAYNYKQTAGVPDYVDDKVWTPSPAVVGGPLQLKHGTKRIRVESIKVRFTAVTDAVRATIATLTGLSQPVQTSGTSWTATWRAVAPGELGNAVTMTIAFVPGTTFGVRNHFAYDLSLGLWVPDLNNVGVLVAGSPTVAALEAAILAETTLVTLVTPDATPSKVINGAAMQAIGSVTGSLTGGVFGAPAGEGLKLTGLGLEVGFERPGLYNRLPAAQRQ